MKRERSKKKEMGEEVKERIGGRGKGGGEK